MVASRRLGPGATVLQADLDRPLEFADCEFDLIVCALVIHYLSDRRRALREFHRVLRPRGRAVISTQHPTADWLRKGGSYFDVVEETDEWERGGQSYPMRFWREPLTELCDAAADAGFVIEGFSSRSLPRRCVSGGRRPGRSSDAKRASSCSACGKTPEARHAVTHAGLNVPTSLAPNCGKTPERAAWLKRLPNIVDSLAERWSLTLGPPFDGAEVSAAWVAPVTRADGSGAVLKLGMPHMEGEHEIAGLRFWDGDPTVALLQTDEELNAMLLERCEPGIHLRSLPLPQQDIVVAGLLRRLWRLPPPPHLSARSQR